MVALVALFLALIAGVAVGATFTGTEDSDRIVGTNDDDEISARGGLKQAPRGAYLSP